MSKLNKEQQELLNTLIEQGLSEDDALSYIESTTVNGGGAALPFPVLRFNYDKDDILEGVPKGAFITGFEIDRENFVVTKQGKVIPEMDMIIIATKFFKEAVNKTDNKTLGITKLLDSTYDLNNPLDKTTGRPLEIIAKEQGGEVKFTAMLVALVRPVGDKDASWEPYVMYLGGATYMSLKEGIQTASNKAFEEVVGKAILRVASKRQKTKYGTTMWVFDVKKVVPFKSEDLVKFVKLSVPHIKAFNEYVSAVNDVVAQENTEPEAEAEQNPVSPTTPAMDEKSPPSATEIAEEEIVI